MGSVRPLWQRTLAGFLNLQFLIVAACGPSARGPASTEGAAAVEDPNDLSGYRADEYLTYIPDLAPAYVKLRDFMRNEIKKIAQPLDEKKKKKDAQTTAQKNERLSKLAGQLSEYVLTTRANIERAYSNPRVLNRKKKVAAAQAYIENIYLPWRDFLLATGQKPPRPWSEYSLRVPLELVEKDSQVESILTEGPAESKYFKTLFGASPEQEEEDPAVMLGLAQKKEEIPNYGLQLRADPSDEKVRLLEPHPLRILSRDMYGYLLNPTKENYAAALKRLTLFILYQQIVAYESRQSSNPKAFEIPDGCHNDELGVPRGYKINQLADLPPEELRDLRVSSMNSVLEANGLIVGSSIDHYKPYWLTALQADPRKDGFSQARIPFEETLKGIEYLRPRKERNKALGRPVIDDYDQFQEILALKGGNAVKVLGPRAKELFESMVTYEHPGDHSAYILKKLKEAGKVSWRDIVPDWAKKELQQRWIMIEEMPPFHSPDSWRRWALRKMAAYIRQNREPNTHWKYKDVLTSACNGVGAECKNNPEAYYDRVASILKPVEDAGENLPKLPIRRDELEKIYPFLRAVWKEARTKGILTLSGTDANGKQYFNSFSRLTEWEYLISQLDSIPPNPWAELRLALLLESRKDVTKLGFWKTWEEDYTFGQLRYQLGFSKGLKPMHADSILRDNEKEQIWSKIVEASNEGNNHIFAQRPPARTETYYDIIAKLSDRTTLSREQVEQAIQEFSQGGGGRSNPMRLEIEDYWARPEAQDAVYFLSLYLAQGDLERQEKIMKDYAAKNASMKDAPVEGAGGDSIPAVEAEEIAEDASYLSLDSLPAESPAAAMLAHDLENKAPIYRRLVYLGALIANTEARIKARELCAVDPFKNPEEFKRLVYSTMKVQNEIMARMGYSELPKDAKKYLDKWWGNDKAQLQVGLLQGGLTIGAFLLTSGSCVIAACIPALIMGAAAVGTGGWLAWRAMEDKHESEERDAFAKAAKSIGLTTEEGVKSYRNKEFGYTEAILNLVFTAPLLGVTAKAGQMSVASTRALVTVARREGWKAGSDAMKAAANSVNVKISRYWLGLRDVGEDLTGKSSKDRRWYHVLAPRPRQLIRATVREALENPTAATSQLVTESAEQINRAFARSIARPFRNNPKKMAEFLQIYIRKANKAAPKLEFLENLANKSDSIWIMRQLNKLRAHPWRVSRISKKLEKGRLLEKLADDISRLGDNGLEDFIFKSADEVGDAMTELFFRKRDIPFYVAAQGLPGTAGLSKGILLKEIANAREILLFEKARADLLKIMGISGRSALLGQRLDELMFRFRTEAYIRGFGRDMKNFEGLVSDQAFEWLAKDVSKAAKASRFLGGGRLDPQALRQILFEPSSAQESALGKWLWSRLPPSAWGRSEEAQRVATGMVRQLSNYQSAQSFDEFYDALQLYMRLKAPNQITN